MKPRPEPKGLKRLRTSDYACQFLTHDSPVHRLGAGWKIAISMALSVLAVGARSPGELTALIIATLGYYFASRLTLFDLWRDLRLFAFQAALVTGLYCLCFGIGHGLWPGLRISGQIILFFLPGAVFLHTTRTGDVMRGLRKVVDYRLAFLVFVSIRFVPFFLRELEEIAAAQRLRGARLHPRQLLDPRSWPDLFHCLLLPLMVRAFQTAAEAARSAEAREFGVRRQRTFYDSTLTAPAEDTRLKAEGRRIFKDSKSIS
jgi:energy-coupling factor transport system permease protein